MIVNDDARRPDTRQYRPLGGWTTLHSWIFLGIVALGFMVIGLQNRYHYLNPQGLGKAYRIDKLFGSIQEFDPSQGWIVAQLQVGSPQALSMMEPPGSRAVPMNMPGAMPQPSAEPSETGIAAPPGAVHREDPGVSTRRDVVAQTPVVQAVKPKESPELSKEEKFKAFQQAFPDFGKDEFQLANDDLYPDWKKMTPNGSWAEFLAVYRDFIQWWNDAGSPPEAGFKLWNDFLTSRK